MIKEIQPYLKKRKDEIYAVDTIEKAAMAYLYGILFEIPIIEMDQSSFQEEEKIAVFGYTALPTTEIKEIQHILQSVLGKRAIKTGMHYSERPLLLAGIYLAAVKISDATATAFLREIIQKKINEFEYFDQYLLYLVSKISFSTTHGEITKESIPNVLSLYALQKVTSSLIQVDEQILRDIIIKKLAVYILSTNITFKDIFLIEFFFKNELIKLFRYNSIDSLTLVRNILSRFADSLFKLIKERRKDHALFKINDEYDVQDILHSMLKPIFSDLKYEDWTPKYAGSSKRLDLVIPSETIIIEVKMIKEHEDTKKFIQELNVDVNSYHSHSHCKFLIGFVYDPYRKINDPNEFYELNGMRKHKGKEYMVEIIINR